MITERQKKFLEFCDKQNKKPLNIHDRNQMVKMIVYNMFWLYIMSENNKSVKMEIAYMFYNMKREITKKIKLWHLIDLQEFKDLLIEKIEIEQQKKLVHQRRRHEKRGDFALSVREWEEVKRNFNFECVYCGDKTKLTYDHFYPFSKGGDFMKGNILPTCKSCNSSKNDRFFEEWYPKQTFYDKNKEQSILEYIDNNKQLALF